MGKLNIKSLRRLCLKHVIQPTTYFSLRKLMKTKNLRVSYERESFNMEGFSEQEYLLYFRFSLKELNSLLTLLKILIVNWLENRIKFSGKEGLCILLRRLSYPSRLSDLVPMFKRDEGTISRIFNFMLKWMYNRHAQSLHSFKRSYLTRSELQELAENSSGKGCPYPNIIGFIDGTCRPICQPKYNQRDMYSGYKKLHVFKYQSVVFTNGLIGLLDGGFIGRKHDAAIVHLSGLLDEMKSFLTNNDGSYYAVYGDLVTPTRNLSKLVSKMFKD